MKVTSTPKLGDTVRVINRADIHWNDVGRVTSICKDPAWDYPIHVSGLRHDTALWYKAEDLAQAEGEEPR